MRSTRTLPKPVLPEYDDLRQKLKELEKELLEPTKKKNPDGLIDFSKLEAYQQEALNILDGVDQSLVGDKELDDDKKAAILTGAFLLTQEKLKVYYKTMWLTWGLTNDSIYKAINQPITSLQPHQQLQALQQFKLNLAKIQTDNLTEKEYKQFEIDINRIDNLLKATQETVKLLDKKLHKEINMHDKKKMHHVNGPSINLEQFRILYQTKPLYDKETQQYYYKEPLDYFKETDPKKYEQLEKFSTQLTLDKIKIMAQTVEEGIPQLDILDKTINTSSQLHIGRAVTLKKITEQKPYASQAKLDALDKLLVPNQKNPETKLVDTLFKQASAAVNPEEAIKLSPSPAITPTLTRK